MALTPAYIDQKLRGLDACRDAMMQGMGFIDLMEDDRGRDLAWIETRLRYLDCQNLFILAAPNEILHHRAPKLKVADPLDRFVPEFWMWCSVNGSLEREQTMRSFGIPDDGENLERLHRTGFICVDVRQGA